MDEWDKEINYKIKDFSYLNILIMSVTLFNQFCKSNKKKLSLELNTHEEEFNQKLDFLIHDLTSYLPDDCLDDYIELQSGINNYVNRNKK
jgi:hypothetical protein